MAEYRSKQTEKLEAEKRELREMRRVLEDLLLDKNDSVKTNDFKKKTESVPGPDPDRPDRQAEPEGIRLLRKRQAEVDKIRVMQDRIQSELEAREVKLEEAKMEFEEEVRLKKEELCQLQERLDGDALEAVQFNKMLAERNKILKAWQNQLMQMRGKLFTENSGD